MSFNAAALKLMADKGLSAHDIAEIATAAESSGDSAADKRRAWDRERKRAEREAMSGGMSGGNPPDPAPNERDILTPTRIQKPKSKDLVKKSVAEIERLEAVGSCLKVAFPPPTGVSDEQWTAFRKQRKKPLNSRSYTLLTNKLLVLAEAGWPPGDMIDLAIERGWETVFEPRDQTNVRRTDSMGRNQSTDGLSSTARAAIAVFGPPGAGERGRFP